MRENAFQILFVLDDVLVFFVASEEVGRRQLLGIADDDRLACPCDGAHCIPGRYLRSLIEDDHIEQPWSGGRYCAVDSGDISMQGASFETLDGMALIISRIDRLGR